MKKKLINFKKKVNQFSVDELLGIETPGDDFVAIKGTFMYVLYLDEIAVLMNVPKDVIDEKIDYACFIDNAADLIESEQFSNRLKRATKAFFMIMRKHEPIYYEDDEK